jgi:type II secretory pathway pseudopilin PulG
MYAAAPKVPGATVRLMSSGKRTQAGFTYLTALLLVAAMGALLAAAAENWSHARQREKEKELLRIGNEFRRAIGLYYHRTPGGIKRYPEKLEDLLEDPRYPNPQRYLRRVYADPITGKPQWDLIPAPEGGIMGVRSVSTGRPLRTIAGAETYGSWQFVYDPPRALK